MAPSSVKPTDVMAYTANGMEEILMAPMTRSRAQIDGTVPTELRVEYYGGRGSEGIIITEG